MCAGTENFLDGRAQLCESLCGLAHMRIDIGFRIGMAETFLDHGDAHALYAAVECLCVAAGRNATLARIEPVRPGDHLQQQCVVAHVRGHRPGGIDRDFEEPDAGIGN